MTRSLLQLLALSAMSACPPLLAAPFVPTDDAEVLERLPFSPRQPAMRELQILRIRLAQQPENLPVAVETARRYIELGRVTGDPRYAGYAQAALAPWWKLFEPPRDVLVLRGILRQRVHEFHAALSDLSQALTRNPRDAQARLTRATVFQVRGELEAARRDCEALNGVTQELIVVACIAGVDSANGRLSESYDLLRATVARYPNSAPGLQVWVLTELAEMAERAGLVQRAHEHYRGALATDPADQYLIAAYADFLLDQGRAREAAELVKAHTRADTLLLRYALALDAEGVPEAAQRVQELRARFDASRMREDRVHLREEARFTLRLAHAPVAALALAKENWTVQKEPADARVLLEAARSANDEAALHQVRQWLETSELQDVRLTRLLSSEPARQSAVTRGPATTPAPASAATHHGREPPGP